jgi:hypothetical protein
MKSKTVIFVCGGMILAGVVIGVSVRKDHLVTQLVAVPVRVPVYVNSPVSTPEASVVYVPPVAAAPVPVQPLPDAVIVPPVVTAPVTYVARQGDTLSEVAIGLLGADNRANRAIVVSANPSLQANPDLVVTGREYTLAVHDSVSAPVATPAKQALAGGVTTTVATVAAPDPVTSPPAAPVLKYTAAKGDTVGTLAGALLGDDTQANRNAIVKANPSLKPDPDHMEAGKAYKIPAPDGLAAADVSPTPATVRPTTQPDADTIVKDANTRTLRYTAKAGDSVNSLALALLGSDTQANRDIILNVNADLKANPDRVIEGKTYWIPAPVAAVTAAQ